MANYIKSVVFIGLALFWTASCLSQSITFNEGAPRFAALVGKPSARKALVVSNTGRDPVFIEAIDATGSFVADDTCKVWLPEGSACLVFVTFTPDREGPLRGKLTVTLMNRSERSLELSGVGLLAKDLGQIQNIETTNDDEKAQELLDDKRYTFDDLLKKNPAPVENAEKVFSLISDTNTKMRLASILMDIGVKDDIYFQYLRREAEKAMSHDHDMPWPVLYDEKGQKESLNPALNDWCKLHGLAFWDMDKVQYYEIPVAWIYLGAAGDIRAYDLLTRGLHSRNLMIQTYAAMGLAKLGDARAVPELIEVGHQAAGEALSGIVRSLIYFDDPRAQEAAEHLLPEKEKDLLPFFREEKSKGTRGIFPW